jgi:hypothetical protein
VVNAIAAVLSWLLPDGFRERQRAEWHGDLAQLDPAARWRYLLTATLTLPSLYLAARRSNPGPYGGWALTLPRRSRGYALVTAFALTAGMFGAAVAGRLTWEQPPPLLPEAASRALTQSVFPGRTVVGDPGAPAFGADPEGATPGGSLFEVPSVPVDRDLRADTDGARDRLAAAGWTIDEDVHTDITSDIVGLTADDVAWSFRAHSDGLVLDFSVWRYAGRTASQYYLRRTTFPRAPVVLLLAAGAAAGLAGWFAACSLYRRIGRRRGGAAVRAAVPTVALFSVLPAAFMLVAREFAAPLAVEEYTPPWYVVFVTGAERPYAYAALAVIFGLWLALLPSIQAPAAAPHWEYGD